MRKPRGHWLKVSSPLFLFTACLCVISHLHGGMLSLCLDFGFSGVCHHAVLLDSASHDPRGGAGPCRRLDGVRDKQLALFCGASPALR